MSTENPTAAVQSSGGWECKPHRPSTERLVAFAFVGGLICGLLPLLWLFGGPWIWFHTPIMLGGLSVLAGILILLLRPVLLAGLDCLYMDDRRIVRVRRTGRYYKKMWAIRVRDVRDVVFTGGSFLLGPFEARIRGRCLYVGTRDVWRFAVCRMCLITFKADAFLSHPRLLDRLITIAESKPKSASRQKAVERARQFAAKASRETPPAVAADDVESPDSIFDSLTGRIRRVRSAGQCVVIAFACMLLAILGITVLTHLRGSMTDLFMQIVPFGLLYGLYAWPIPWRSRYRWVHAAMAMTLLLVAFFLSTVFIRFLAFLWFAMAAYLILLIHRIAVLRFGRSKARRVSRSVAALATVYVAATTMYFTNWQTGRIETVFSIPDQRFGCAPQNLAVSPDGKMLSFTVMFGRFPKTVAESGGWFGLADWPHWRLRNLLELRFMDMKEIMKDDGSLAVFTPAAGGPTKVLAIPRTFLSCPRWLPDCQKMVFVGWFPGDAEAGQRVWLADPFSQSQRIIYKTSDSLVIPKEAFTSDGVTLRALTCGRATDGKTTRSRVLINIETGSVTTEALPRLNDGSTSHGDVSPNRRWVAASVIASKESCVMISQKKDGKPVASIPIGHGKDGFDFHWSPDSRKLAISRLCRTWVYDIETSRTTVVKTWRRGSIIPAEIAWAPDSKSFYFIRHVAGDFLIGVEIVRVWLRE